MHFLFKPQFFDDIALVCVGPLIGIPGLWMFFFFFSDGLPDHHGFFAPHILRHDS